jgi:glycosyltransferase involved in cell wall biosynthesis
MSLHITKFSGNVIAELHSKINCPPEMEYDQLSQVEALSLPSKKYVLVLPGWYPTKQDPFLGDFNQRFVKAASLHTPQVVLYIVKDQCGLLRKVKTEFIQASESIVEIIVWYPRKKGSWVDAFYSNTAYVQLLIKYAEIIRQKWGKPALLHCYIVIRGGLGGLLLGSKWRLPYILSENWTIFYPSDPGYLKNRNPLFKLLVRLVYRNAAKFLPVTLDLKERAASLLGSRTAAIIPNVVDTSLFSFTGKHHLQRTFRFIHVSTMTYQKNPHGLLRGFKKFSLLYPQACLWMVGPVSPEVSDFARDLQLKEGTVHFTGPVSYSAVAEHLLASDALVLFSRYENLPCVVLEALCAGLPVISTSVGGIAEVIDSSNGILVSSENEELLTDAFTRMFSSYHIYDRESISRVATSLFSYPAVAGLIKEAYRLLEI